MSEPTATQLDPATVLTYRSETTNVPAGWTNVSAHGVRPELAHLVWRRTLRVLLTLWAPLFVGGIAFFAWTLREDPQNQLLALIFAPAAMIATMSFRLWRSRRLFNKRIASFRIIVSNEGVLRMTAMLPDLVIPFDQVSRISETRDGLLIRGRRGLDLVMIPTAIEGYDALRSRLAAVQPFKKGGQGRLAIAVILYLTLIGGYFVGATTSSHELRWGIIFLLTLIAIWTMVQTLSSPNTTLRQKITAPAVLILPLILLALEMLPRIWHWLFP